MSLVQRFPEREFSIRRLHAQSADFRAICDDYEEAARALRFWETSAGHAERALEYRGLLAEFEVELLKLLDNQ